MTKIEETSSVPSSVSTDLDSHNEKKGCVCCCRGRLYRHLTKNEMCGTGVLITTVGVGMDIFCNALILSADSSRVKGGSTSLLVIINVGFGLITLLGLCALYNACRNARHKEKDEKLLAAARIDIEETNL